MYVKTRLLPSHSPTNTDLFAMSTAIPHGPLTSKTSTYDWLCVKSMATMRLLPRSHTKTQFSLSGHIPHGSKQRGEHNWLFPVPDVPYHFFTEQSRPISHTLGHALTASMPLAKYVHSMPRLGYAKFKRLCDDRATSIQLLV